jgi:hypothetical protein
LLPRAGAGNHRYTRLNDLNGLSVNGAAAGAHAPTYASSPAGSIRSTTWLHEQAADAAGERRRRAPAQPDRKATGAPATTLEAPPPLPRSSPASRLHTHVDEQGWTPEAGRRAREPARGLRSWRWKPLFATSSARSRWRDDSGAAIATGATVIPG